MKRMKKLATKIIETLPNEWLENLNDDQRTRIELLYEELTELMTSHQAITHAIKQACDKELMLAAHSCEC